MFFVNKNSENIFEKFLKKRLTFVLKLAIITLAVADVAELADAHGSGPCESNFMGVQVPSSAPKEQYPFGCCSFFVFDMGLEGRVLENSPVDCFPAPPLRPQAGKSLHPHQSLVSSETRLFLVFTIHLCYTEPIKVRRDRHAAEAHTRKIIK